MFSLFAFYKYLTFKVVTILILENACFSCALSSKPSYEEALDRAYSQFITSNTYDALIEQFSTNQIYSIPQLVEFISNYHL
jgi:uncharacterized membrane protein YukC